MTLDPDVLVVPHAVAGLVRGLPGDVVLAVCVAPDSEQNLRRIRAHTCGRRRNGRRVAAQLCLDALFGFRNLKIRVGLEFHRAGCCLQISVACEGAVAVEVGEIDLRGIRSIRLLHCIDPLDVVLTVHHAPDRKDQLSVCGLGICHGNLRRVLIVGDGDGDACIFHITDGLCFGRCRSRICGDCRSRYTVIGGPAA